MPHATERWTGNRIIISAYSTRVSPLVDGEDRKTLRELGFRLPPPQQAQPQVYANTAHAQDQPPEQPTPEEIKNWEAKIAKFHKAAGHPTNRNLARILKDAPWKVQAALDHRCPACESLRPGGVSSGNIPPASTGPTFKAWQAVAVDAGEWVIPQSKFKLKFLLFTDMATKLRMVQPLQTYPILEMRTESTEDVIRSFSERWLGIFPKPQVVILDAANTFTSDLGEVP